MKKAQIKLTTIVIIAVLVVIAIAVIVIATVFLTRQTTTGNVVNVPSTTGNSENKNSYHPYNEIVSFQISCIKKCPKDFPDYVNENCMSECASETIKNFPEFKDKDFSDDTLRINLDSNIYLQFSCTQNCWEGIKGKMIYKYSCIQGC